MKLRINQRSCTDDPCKGLYLEMLSDVLGVPDGAVRKWVVKRLGVKSIVLKGFDHDAGTLIFDKVTVFICGNRGLK